MSLHTRTGYLGVSKWGLQISSTSCTASCSTIYLKTSPSIAIGTLASILIFTIETILRRAGPYQARHKPCYSCSRSRIMIWAVCMYHQCHRGKRVACLCHSTSKGITQYSVSIGSHELRARLGFKTVNEINRFLTPSIVSIVVKIHFFSFCWTFTRISTPVKFMINQLARSLRVFAFPCCFLHGYIVLTNDPIEYSIPVPARIIP